MGLPSRRSLTASLVLSCWLYRRYVAVSSRTVAAAAASTEANRDDDDDNNNRFTAKFEPITNTRRTAVAAFLGFFSCAWYLTKDVVISEHALAKLVHTFATTTIITSGGVVRVQLCVVGATLATFLAPLLLARKLGQWRRRDGGGGVDGSGGGVYAEDAVVGIACRRRGW